MTVSPVTLVVPTWNGGELFRRQLAALRAASPRPERVLVLDSSSTDGTPEAARAAGCEVVGIDRAEFDHGATRMQGVLRATTPFVAFLSQDALPEPDWLGALMEPFSDARVAGASARILPLPESSLLARRTVLAAPGADATPRTFGTDDSRAFAALRGLERRTWCRFDNVASLARRDLLLRFPFPRTMMGEDVAFAEAVLAAGYRVAFVPGAVVRHAHEYGFAGAFRRYRDDARFVRRRFGEPVRSGLLRALRGFAYEVREDLRFLARERGPGRLRALARSPSLRLGQVLGQWWGSRPAGAGGAGS